MRFINLAILSVVLIPVSSLAQATTAAPGPEIEVVDGKVSMNLLGVPLSRVLTMLDRATGLKSKVAPELANRTVSARFTRLDLKDAVHKIFEGQPFNYMLIEGKGIDVSGLAVAGGTTSTTVSSPFADSGPISQPIPVSSPLQPAGAVQVNVAQPVTGNAAFPPTANPTGNPAANPANTNPVSTPSQGIVPGQLPPPVGASTNPLGGAPQQVPVTGFPGAPVANPVPQPTGPGAPTVTPGTIRQ